MKEIIASCVFILFTTSNIWSQDITKAKPLTTSDNINKNITSIISNNVADFPNATQLSIAIIDGDNTEYIGIIREGDQLKNIENQSAIFEIGSISKVFTSVLLAKQIDSGSVTLEDNLYAKDAMKNEKATATQQEITFQMLANHTSGLPRIPQNMLGVMMANQNNPYQAYTTEMLEEFYQSEWSPQSQPGKQYAYSNLGTGTLGYLLAKKAGTSYETLLEKDILIPLKMESTSSARSKIDSNRLVPGLNSDGSPASNWDFTDALVGAGGILSNVLDMEKFVRQNFTDDPVYVMTQTSTHTVNDNLDIGLGWHISKEGEQRFLWHNGGTGGYRSCIFMDKANKKAVIILSNVSAFGSTSENIDKLCYELLKS